MSTTAWAIPSPLALRGTNWRTSQTVGGVTTEYVLDVAGGLPEVIVATTGGASTYYVQVGGQILAQYGSGAWAYALPDHLGSVRQLTNAGGQVSLAQGYDPFGGLFESAGAGTSPFGYTGEWYESYSQLVFLRTRYYDPQVGRLLSKDPWSGSESWPQSLNGWNYVAGNPINATDPSGYFVVPLHRICIFGVDPETDDCKDPFGIPPIFATTMAVDPASATAQVALTVLTYLTLGLIDDLEVSPPPFPVGNPWEGWRESIPAEEQSAPHILSPPLGYTAEWLTPVLPGPYVDDVPPAPHILDFPRVRPCFDDSILLSRTRCGIKRDNVGYFKKLLKKHPDILGKASKAELRAGRMPFVDSNWIKYYPEHEPNLGEKLTVHHVDGWIEKPIPSSWHSDHHMPGGTRYNPGNP